MPVSKAVGRNLQCSGRAQGGDGDAGILELVAPIELGRRQVEQAGIVLIDQAAAFLGCDPILAGDPDRRLDPRRLALDCDQGLAHLRRDDRRHVRFEDAGLLAGDLGESLTEMLGMIERHRRDHGGERALDHIGRIQSPAEPDFEQEHIRPVACKQQEACRGGDLEHGDGRSRIHALAFVERLLELFIRSEAAFTLGAEPEALVEAHEMR